MHDDPGLELVQLDVNNDSYLDHGSDVMHGTSPSELKIDRSESKDEFLTQLKLRGGEKEYLHIISRIRKEQSTEDNLDDYAPFRNFTEATITQNLIHSKIATRCKKLQYNILLTIIRDTRLNIDDLQKTYHELKIRVELYPKAKLYLRSVIKTPNKGKKRTNAKRTRRKVIFGGKQNDLVSESESPENDADSESESQDSNPQASKSDNSQCGSIAYVSPESEVRNLTSKIDELEGYLIEAIQDESGNDIRLTERDDEGSDCNSIESLDVTFKPSDGLKECTKICQFNM